MRKFLVFCFYFCLFTCDDGDIITVELDFDDTFAQCGDLVLYNVKTDPAESLSVIINSTVANLTNVGDNGTLESSFVITSTNTFNYRTYDTNLPSNYFCSDVPPSGIAILSDEQSIEGTVNITTTLIEDDNDGIPAFLEDENTDGDNNPATNPTDTDGDGIPNYLDEDDDGDNVKTITERPDPNNDGNLDDAQNTDADFANGDTLPDYLDNDDDADGVLTRDEESVNPPNQDPTDDVTDSNAGADYLNPAVTNSVSATAYRVHAIQQTYIIRCIVNDIQLPQLAQQTFDFGTLEPAPTGSRTLTPDFN